MDDLFQELKYAGKEFADEMRDRAAHRLVRLAMRIATKQLAKRFGIAYIAAARLDDDAWRPHEAARRPS